MADHSRIEWSREWEAIDTLHWARVSVSQPGGHYPAFVEVEGDINSLLSSDARALAKVLVEAADYADSLEPPTDEAGSEFPPGVAG